MQRFCGWMRPQRLAIWGASLCALFASVLARAQAPQSAPGPPMIRAIDVQYTGPATLSKERILAQMRTKVGQPYSNEVVQEDIKALYKTGYIRNVRIFAQPEGDGVKVIVAVQTRAIVHEIEITGAERGKPTRLRKEIKVKLNQALDEQQLEEARQKIIEIYQGRGFTNVSVDFRIDPIDEKRGTARVVFTVNEGVKGAVSQIRFEGNAHVSQKVLRKQMKTRGKTLIHFMDKSGRLDEVQLEQDLDKIREYYQDHGFIDVEIKDVRKERTEKGPMIITIVISEGPQYHVRKLTITGYQHTTEPKVRILLKMKEGSVYSPKQMRDDAKAVADAYGIGGYVDLVIVPEGSPAGTATINVHYKIEEGDRYFVQRINVVGNTRTKDKVIRREVLIAPGDVFNTVRVETSKKRLENLGYFSKVDTFPVDTEVEGRKYLDIQVEEKRTGSLNFGAGFSTVDSLIGFIELTQGNFDITNWPSLTGGGQKFRIRLQGGTERKDVELALTEPWFMDRPISVSFSSFYHEANYLSSLYDQRNYGFSLDVRKGILPYLYGSLGYRLESIDTFNVVVTASDQLLAETGPSTKSVVTAGLVWDRRDNPFLTRHGERITYTWWVAGPGGTEQIYGFDVEASKYWHLPWDTILLVNAEVAGVDKWGSQTKIVKIYDRLFLGGSNNLRGFEFRDVGPKDEHGEPLGGQSMARATIEFTFPIIEKARGAIFYDTGFVNTNPWDYNFNNVASDIGFGLRLDLPIGPLRVDYGIPIQQAGNHGSGKFNFNVGYQF